tara:strand:+ start:23925 stop:26651 length:2727 start_codon:yes stop_codon:yes gene_type:complete
MADKQITRRLKIYVNGQEVDATLTNLQKNLTKFRTLSNRAVEGTPEWKKYNAEVAKLEVELKQARSAQTEFRKETKLTEAGINKSEQALSDFTGSFTTMIQGYKRGDILQVKEGFNGVRQGISGATKAALAFIATPIGAAIAVLVGVGAAAKAWFDYNSQVVEALRLTQQITGLTDGAADNARIRAEALTEAFGVDFKETLLTANALAQQFGISFDEAFDVLEGQLVRGQKNNDEFFQNLNEYPTFFKQAGFSAQEFGRIIATGYDLGIYKDKLPDALKEFDIAIKEQTDTTRDALVNAFGAAFTDDVLSRIEKGEITTKTALEEISKEAQDSNINIQQNAQLTADLFKGAGEDAGGAMKIFEAYNVAINENQRELTESEQITQDQINATKELKSITSSLFSTGDEGFGLLIDKAKLFGTEVLIDILTAGVDVYNWFVDLNNESRVFSGILTTIGVAATAPFKVLSTLVSAAKDNFGNLGDVIEGVFTLDFDKIKAAMQNGLSATGDVLDELKAKAKADAAEIQAAFNGENKFERKSLNDFISEDTPTSPTSTGNAPLKEGGTDELTPEDNKTLNSRKKLLAYLKQLEEEEAIQNELKKVEDDLRAEEEEVLRLEKKFEKMAEEAGLTNDLAAELSEEEKSLAAQLEDAKEAEIQLVRDKHAAIREKKNAESLKKIEQQDAANKKDQIKAETELQDARRGLLELGIDVLASFFGESSALSKAFFLGEKAVAAANVIIDGVAERAKISAAWGWNPVVATPLLTASKIRTISNLAAIAGTAIKGFELGGETFSGNYSGGVDGRGGQLSVLHPNEYVVPEFVRQDPEVPAILGYLEQKRQQKLGSFENGGDTTSSPVTPVDSSNSLLVSAVQLLIEKLDEPLKILYTLNDEIERRELAEKLDDTINESKGK